MCRYINTHAHTYDSFKCNSDKSVDFRTELNCFTPTQPLCSEWLRRFRSVATGSHSCVGSLSALDHKLKVWFWSTDREAVRTSPLEEARRLSSKTLELVTEGNPSTCPAVRPVTTLLRKHPADQLWPGADLSFFFSTQVEAAQKRLVALLHPSMVGLGDIILLLTAPSVLG